MDLVENLNMFSNIVLWYNTLFVSIHYQCQILSMLDQLAKTNGNSFSVREYFEKIRVFFTNYNILRNLLELKIEQFVKDCRGDLDLLLKYRTALQDLVFDQKLSRLTNLTRSLHNMLESMVTSSEFSDTRMLEDDEQISFCLCFQTLKGGISKESFTALPTTRFAFIPPTNDYGDEETDDDVACPICLLEYKTFDRVTFLPCMHYFHTHCAKHWFPTNVSCPICRSRVNL